MNYVYVLFACICLCDYLWHKIPNLFVAGVFALGEWVSYCSGGAQGVVAFNGVALFAGCAFYLFFQMGALGAGDVKLIASTAGLVPFTLIPVYLFMGFFLAACVGAFKILRRGEQKSGTGVCLAGPMFISFLVVGGMTIC